MAVTLTTEEVVAIAEEAKGYQERISELESENIKLRYERLMAKAAYFNQHHDVIGAIWKQSKTQKMWRDYAIQWYRIANAIDIRLAKLKEQM